jgi:dolichol-phosphate mannosyltransferase
MNKLILSILIPAYLEEENLRILLPRIKKVANSLNINYEIIIIDTCQPMDNTQEVCENEEVSYLNREGGNKYGDAVRTAIKYAKGNYFLFMDADGSHSPEFILQMYTNIADNDIIIASRYVDGGSSDNGRTQIFMSWCVNAMYSLFFHLKCKDVSNSFKIYKKEIFDDIVLKCKNFDIIEEILIKGKRKKKNLRIKEIPYIFKERMFGHTKRNLIAFVFSYFFTLIRLKFFV